jgi:predicted dehydrogenase
LQKNCAGGLYNTGPHPVGLALGFLDFDEKAKIEFCKLGTALTSGDADDYAKIIITAPNKPVIDVEVTSCDAYCNYNLRVIGSKGNLMTNFNSYKMMYIVDGENVERPVQESFLADENGEPIYCGEKLIKHEEEAKFEGNAFDIGTAKFYEELYYKITEGKELIYGRYQ